MAKENYLKIVATFIEEQPISPNNVKVFLNNEPIGPIQELRFVANKDKCDVKITFPSLKRIDKVKFKDLIHHVDKWINKLKSMLAIKVYLKRPF
jgi:hypothetical protein